ncbi:MAG TPA: hypothetical protein D7H81_02640, partial [Candidatus Poseidoniales archaeon]
MSGFNRDRNIKVPKKTEKKPAITPSNYLPSRPAEGRIAVPKKVAQPPKTRSNNKQNSRRGGNQRVGKGRNINQGRKQQRPKR